MNKTTWQRVKLGEVAEINPLESIKKNTLAKKVSMDNLEPFNKKIYSFSMESFKGGSKFKNGDTLLARITPCLENGKTAFVDFLENNEIAFGSTEFIILREKENISDKHFLYYLARSENFRETAIKSMTGSSGRERVQIEVIRDYEFSLPPLETQQRIAEILSSLDDKIDLLHRQNKTLESLSLTLFRHTFIDNPKRNEWEKKPLNEIAEIKIGRTPPRKEKQWFSTNPKNTKWISIKDMEGNIFIFNTAECLTDEAIEKFNIPIIPKGVVNLSFKMTLGRVSITTENMLSNEAIAHFNLYDKYEHFTEYLYLFLKTFKYETLGSTSSIVTAINTSLIKNIKIAIPDKTTLNDFQIQAKGFFDKIYNNAKQIRNLQSMRDMLLAKILNEKMEV
ncbi:restriction endonuclease subunit S [uncultured Helicobacter sp.]|uniref:restriction endonuclease subunit S n=1 Tax=uncultured Helicobacter sp. TaxID=175537 RepID=UPI00262CFB8F|nr:restriction endonuclease subunit S [uncultured Helicobacter sp.]